MGITLKQLRKKKPVIEIIAEKCGANPKNIKIFGEILKGKKVDTAEFLFETKPDIGLEFLDIYELLEVLLGCKVSIATSRNIFPTESIKDYIFSTAVKL